MEGLSSFADSILPIIAIAVIGVRILTKVIRRQPGNREQARSPAAAPSQTAPPQKDTGGFHPWQDEYRDPSSPVTIEAAEQESLDDDGDEFSAWSLSINDEETAKPVPSTPPERTPDTKKASIFTTLSSTSSVPVSGEIPAWLQSPVQPVPPAQSYAEASVPVAAGMENRAPEAAPGDGGSPDRRPSAHPGVESYIRSLPPLQQGIVWAEILGIPKGL
ncbi:hypothetical protein AGMMS4952_21240 [Spirochaetia bacterium]|nr:hypothetical protein AGMMS4952_21240 [Spirochaetia bacterium]